MTEAMLQKVVAEAVQGQLFENWKFYALLLCFALVSTAFNAFVGSYLRKRGDVYATKTDFDALLAQVAATTQATEQIKTSIARSDWSEKEWTSARRAKLEEFLESVYATQDWLKKSATQNFSNVAELWPSSPVWKVEMLVSLYFPELEKEARQLMEMYYDFTAIYIGLVNGLRSADAASDREAHKKTLDAMVPALTEKFSKMYQYTTTIPPKASALMHTIVAGPQTAKT